MKKLYIILILATFLFHFNSAQQNLCAEARAKGFTFAADPSDCKSYLYCEPDTKITHILKCDDDYPNFHNDTCWDADMGCKPCPTDPGQGIKFAYVKDGSETDVCKGYALCYETAAGTGIPLGDRECPGNLHFDRNSGACVDSKLAPCDSSSSPNTGPNCAGKDNGVYVVIPGTDCTKYTACYNNKPVEGSWECPPGEVFQSEKEGCDVPGHDFNCEEEEGKRRLFINGIVPDHIPRAKNMRY